MNPGPIYPRIDPIKVEKPSEETLRLYADFTVREMVIKLVDKMDTLEPKIEKAEKDIYDLKVKVYSVFGAVGIVAGSGILIWLIDFLS